MSNLANCRVHLKFNNSAFVQKSFSSLYNNSTWNLYKLFELNTWPRNPATNFTLKNCLFGTFKLVRNAIKSKFTYNGGGISFDGEGSWSFGNDLARNFAIFGVNNSSSYPRQFLRISWFEYEAFSISYSHYLQCIRSFANNSFHAGIS